MQFCIGYIQFSPFSLQKFINTIVLILLAGSTALGAPYQDMAVHGGISPVLLNDGAVGFLLHPFSVAGIATLLSAGRRVAHGAVPAIISALTGIAARAVLGPFV